MLELYKGEIPHCDELSKQIKLVLEFPETSVEAIRHMIYEHIMKYAEQQNYRSWKIMARKAMNISYNAIDNVIVELEPNELNAQRLKDYIKYYHSYIAYEKLVFSFYFDGLITEDERLKIIKRGKEVFIDELTDHW